MSLDLYERETAERMNSLAPMLQPEGGAFDGFVRGTGQYTMRGFAQAGRAVSLAASTVPIALDAFTDGTELQDKYFRFHDEVFGEAVDYWTPRPGEVGVAGQIAGTLLSTLPLVIASPAAAVGAVQLSTAEDLARAGVSPGKAQAVGAVQSVGLGLGIYMPIFGQSLWQRMLLGGAGFNVVQGAAMRGASDVILRGTPAEGQYEAFDGTALTLDVLLGLGFGAITHLSPAQRAQGAETWRRLTDWGQSLKADDVEALATLRQAQHANVDSLPGRPAEGADVDAHRARVRTAVEQLLRDEPVNVADLPEGRYRPVPERFAEAEVRARQLLAEAERVRVAEGLPKPPEPETTPARAAELEPEQTSATPAPDAEPATLLTRLRERIQSLLAPEAPAPAARAEPTDPVAREAQRFVDENPDALLVTGHDPDGRPITRPVREVLAETRAEVERARADAKLFEVAAGCLLGVS